jgi:DNA replication protein DnaD
MTQSKEISRGALFDVYINEILKEWNTNNIKGIQITRKKEIKTLLFADDQVIIAESETSLQKSVGPTQIRKQHQNMD